MKMKNEELRMKNYQNSESRTKLASVMLSGGYGNNRFFSKNTRDLFMSPQANGLISYGIGWWREADDKRVWYFGSQAPESSIGHQGWTGTFTMIDFENNMVIVFLTNSVNTPIADTSSLPHPSNALTPISVTLFDISTDSRVKQPKNALFPIFLTLSGIKTILIL